MRILPIGVGDAFSALWYSSSIVVEHEGTRLLIDCSHPIRKILREASHRAATPMDIGDIDAVLLTHLHADHCSGLEGYGYFYRFVLSRRAALYAHPMVSERLWGGALAAGMEQLLPAADASPNAMELADYFDVHSLSLDAETTIGPFTVECRSTIHHVPTTAFRISAGDASLGFSADTAFDPSLIEWLSKSTRFVHETNYGIHTPYEKLAQLPEDVRKKMWIIHYPDAFDMDTSVIEPLREGQWYEVTEPA